jgi:LDH2 family malate/lactate/ureidoglycolate dehydrogenase
VTSAERIRAEALERWVQALFEAAGLASGAARTVADALVETNLRGVDSHGVARVADYVARLRAGGLNLRPEPRVLSEDGAVAVVDGDDGPGQVAGVFATDLSVELARRHGAGAVVVRRSNHYGAAGIYAIRAARAGMVAMSTTNADPLVIPFGGAQRALGTNPIAFAAPTPGEPFVLDMATSQVAINRIYNARDEGRPIPEGWGVDGHGVGTTDPAAVHAGVPLGGYKGYGLALMVEVLSGVLTGAGVTGGVGRLHDDHERAQDVGHFHLALDPGRLAGAGFAPRLAALLDELRAMAPAPGHDEVLVAGDPEARARAERERAGIPLPAVVRARLEELSRELGVEIPD